MSTRHRRNPSGREIHALRHRAEIATCLVLTLLVRPTSARRRLVPGLAELRPDRVASANSTMSHFSTTSPLPLSCALPPSAATTLLLLFHSAAAAALILLAGQFRTTTFPSSSGPPNVALLEPESSLLFLIWSPPAATDISIQYVWSCFSTRSLWLRWSPSRLEPVHSIPKCVTDGIRDPQLPL